MPEKIPRVVETVRVSTQGQADRDTPELQRRGLDKLKRSRPGNIVVRIEELGVSGALSVAQRQALRQLEELSAAKAYDELRVYAIDRLTRADSAAERFVIWGLVEQAGAIIVDASGQVLDPKEDGGEVNYYFQTYAAAKERRRLIKRTTEGRQRAAELGRLPSGLPPYGRRFDRATKTWEMVPAQVEVYRRVIAEALAGHSARDIARDLAVDGSTTARGGRWDKSVILQLLKRESIVGRWHTCGQVIQIPPILDELTWARVKAAVAAKRAWTGPKPKVEAMLRGLLHCSGCGMRAYVGGGGIKPYVYHRYSCPTAHRRAGGCTTDRFGVDVKVADRVVREALLNALVHPKVLRAAVEAGRSCIQAPPTLTLATVVAELAKLSRQEAQVLRLLGDDKLSEGVARDRLGEIRAATTAAETKRRDLAAGTDEAPAARGEAGAAQAAALLGKDLARATATEFRELLGLLIPRRAPYGLRLYRDRIDMVGRLPLSPDILCGNLATASGSSRQIPFVPFHLSIALKKAS